jgi:hypothetical protein
MGADMTMFRLRCAAQLSSGERKSERARLKIFGAEMHAFIEGGER